MIGERVATLNEFANRLSAGPWVTETSFDRESMIVEAPIKHLQYWVNSAADTWSMLSHQTDIHDRSTDSTLEFADSQGHPHKGRVFCLKLFGAAEEDLEAGLEKALISHIPSNDLPTQVFVRSHGKPVTIRASDGSIMAVARKVTELAPFESSKAFGMVSGPSFGQAASSLNERLVGLHALGKAGYALGNIELRFPSEPGLTDFLWQTETEEITTSAKRVKNYFDSVAGEVVFVRRTDDVHPVLPGIDTNPSRLPILYAFAKGHGEQIPSTTTLEAASQIIEAAISKAAAKEINVDETDGALSFELRLHNGLLVVGELSVGGDLQANFYRDQHPNPDAGLEDIWVNYLPSTSAEELVALF